MTKRIPIPQLQIDVCLDLNKHNRISNIPYIRIEEPLQILDPCFYNSASDDAHGRRPPLILYNTLKRRKEPFVPQDPHHVTFYACGPTVYDNAHLGNLRSNLVFDTLYRVLKAHYPKVTYVRNITDIDDKIIDAARKGGETIGSLTKRTTEKFHADMTALGILPPTLEPRATDHIPQMIELITALIDRGHAYVSEGHVLFSVLSFPLYGQLSGLSLEEQKSGIRVDIAEYKTHPADFILWKPSPHEPDFPGWESPWGYGRPGWHIECSAMSKTYLGNPFDIHGGGQDLIFPHHENEIAQSCCATGSDTLAHFWVHNGILTVDGEKMSKTLGNFITAETVLRSWPGEVVRWIFLSSHYRSAFDWTEEGLLRAKACLDRLYGALRGQTDADVSQTPSLDTPFMEALRDDLNTPLAISCLHQIAKSIYQTDDPSLKTALRNQLRTSGQFLGVLTHTPEAWFQEDLTPSSSAQSLKAEEIEGLIQERSDARAQKNFQRSDDIRDLLLKAGILLEDTPHQTLWRKL